MTELKDKTVRVPWGSWDLKGRWVPNPLLKMSPQEQAKRNRLNGFEIDKIWMDEWREDGN